LHFIFGPDQDMISPPLPLFCGLGLQPPDERNTNSWQRTNALVIFNFESSGILLVSQEYNAQKINVQLNKNSTEHILFDN